MITESSKTKAATTEMSLKDLSKSIATIQAYLQNELELVCEGDRETWENIFCYEQEIEQLQHLVYQKVANGEPTSGANYGRKLKEARDKEKQQNVA